MIGIPVGILYANATEWLLHKYVLHGMGKKKGSFWSFHWHDHHNKSRRTDMVDDQYVKREWGWNSRTKEMAALTAGALLHLPLFPVAPFFTVTVVACSLNYYRVHSRAHTDPAWAREHLPWHVDHHLGPNQDANWCVTFPLFDMIMGTRRPYLGTEAQEQAEFRAARRAA